MDVSLLAPQAQGVLGLLAFPLIAWVLSERRGDLDAGQVARLVAVGTIFQLIVAAALLNLPILRAVFDGPARAIEALQSATLDGVRLVFGYLAGATPPFDVTKPENSFVLAFQALPIILIMSVLAKLFYHWGILQRVVAGFAWALERTLGVNGPVATSAAANVFVGMVEAPLLIRPYLATMSRSGLFQTMTVGMATIAGTVFALYATILKDKVDGAAGHLLIASVISVPAALLIAALMVPEGPDATSEEKAETTPPAPVAEPTRSSMDAVTAGTREGIELLASITAMLIVAVALVSLANMLLGALTAPMGLALDLQTIVGWIFAPLAWLAGVPSHEAATAGSLLGLKTILNEFVAYLQMAGLPDDALSDRSRLIMTYALCGFANFGSLGIMLGGLTAMAPTRRQEIVELGGKTIISGTLATLMTGAVVGVIAPA
ncbi:MAG: nucleoside transporter C-terminal domain-containing protein [Hyphomicrobium sp.]|nr:nucleoside transporter C-terminal domain-containing protein [Hyphomicrobium sp.]